MSGCWTGPHGMRCSTAPQIRNQKAESAEPARGRVAQTRQSHRPETRARERPEHPPPTSAPRQLEGWRHRHRPPPRRQSAPQEEFEWQHRTPRGEPTTRGGNQESCSLIRKTSPRGVIRQNGVYQRAPTPTAPSDALSRAWPSNPPCSPAHSRGTGGRCRATPPRPQWTGADQRSPDQSPADAGRWPRVS